MLDRIAPPDRLDEQILQTDRQLASAGIRCLLFDAPAGFTSGGLCLRVDLEHQQPSAVEAILARCEPLLLRGVPVNLTLAGFTTKRSPLADLYSLCERIAGSFDAAALSGGLLGTAMASHQMPLKSYQLICHAELGQGPRYVTLESLQMRDHANGRVQEETDFNWRYLWSQRAGLAPLLPAYAAGVRSACPLLADEASSAILPAFGVPVPLDTAWLPLEIDLRRFLDTGGALRWPALRQSLETGMQLADSLLDKLTWCGGQQASDARQNRRIALLVSGLGDVVKAGGGNPGDLDSLQEVCAIAALLRSILRQASVRLARRDGPLPALLRTDPSLRWRDPQHRQHWRQRWQDALQKSATRHRNLLVLSPYSVVPADSRGAAAYTDLLPVLKYADAYSFANPSAFDDWNVKEFKRFHQRAWAIIQRRDATSCIAAGV